jgi:hypothetical protein
MKNIKFVLLLWFFPFSIILFGVLFIIPCTLSSLVFNLIGNKDKAKQINDIEQNIMCRFNHTFFHLLSGE